MTGGLYCHPEERSDEGSTSPSLRGTLDVRKNGQKRVCRAAGGMTKTLRGVAEGCFRWGRWAEVQRGGWGYSTMQRIGNPSVAVPLVDQFPTNPLPEPHVLTLIRSISPHAAQKFE